MVSIPLRSDFNSGYQYMFIYHRYVSIPLRSDFNQANFSLFFLKLRHENLLLKITN